MDVPVERLSVVVVVGVVVGGVCEQLGGHQSAAPGERRGWGAGVLARVRVGSFALASKQTLGFIVLFSQTQRKRRRILL